MSDRTQAAGGSVTLIPAVRHDAASLMAPLAAATAVLAVPFAAVLVVVCLVSTVIPWWIGLLVGIVAAAVVVYRRFVDAHDRVIRTLFDAAPVVATTSVRLDNMVNGMALTGGVAVPDIAVVADEAMNAMAIRRGDQLSVAVTSGLVTRAELIELEGVVAELVARLRNGDAEAATVEAALFELGGGVIGRLLSLPAASMRRLLLDDGRDLLADRQAVWLTRYPPGLVRALDRIRGDETSPASYSRALDGLWLVDPNHRVSETGSTAVVDGHRAPLELRIDVLSEL